MNENSQIALRPSYWASVSGGKDSFIREKELGRPFSCVSSTSKYNAEYLEKIVKTKWLKKLEEIENEA